MFSKTTSCLKLSTIDCNRTIGPTPIDCNLTIGLTQNHLDSTIDKAFLDKTIDKAFQIFSVHLDSTIDKAFLDTTINKAFQKISFTSIQPSTKLFSTQPSTKLFKIFVHLDSTIDKAELLPFRHRRRSHHPRLRYYSSCKNWNCLRPNRMSRHAFSFQLSPRLNHRQSFSRHNHGQSFSKCFVHFNSIIARAFDVNPLDQAKGYKSEISQISLECLSALSPENPNPRLCLGVLVLFLLPPNLLPPPREHVTFTGLG